MAPSGYQGLALIHANPLRMPTEAQMTQPLRRAWIRQVDGRDIAEKGVGKKHLRTIFDQWLKYYYEARPHRGLGNVPISAVLAPEVSLDDFRKEDVVCHETLSGLLNHYGGRRRDCEPNAQRRIAISWFTAE